MSKAIPITAIQQPTHEVMDDQLPWFSRHIPSSERRRASRVNRGERGLWQRCYWERLIRDEADPRSHLDYIHFNPVKHGHVRKAADWPYSTFHRYVQEGILPSDWGVAIGADVGFGERM